MQMTDAERAARNARITAFRSSAKRAKPTKAHRAAMWECMLGTVYTANRAGVVEYHDYDYAQAIAHIGAHHDVRCYRTRAGLYYALGNGAGYEVPAGKLVWFVIFD